MEKTARRARIWALVLVALAIAALALQQPLLEWANEGFRDLTDLVVNVITVVFYGGFAIGAALLSASVVLGAISRDHVRDIA